MQIMMMGRPIRRTAPVTLNPTIKPIVFLAELEVLELKSITRLRLNVGGLKVAGLKLKVVGLKLKVVGLKFLVVAED